MPRSGHNTNGIVFPVYDFRKISNNIINDT